MRISDWSSDVCSSDLLADGAVVGHEALLRWNHELHGPLPPGEFIGVGEDSGLIEQVDWLMYRRVFDWMSRHGDGYVSINVSPRHFHAETFAERLLRMADDPGPDPRPLRHDIATAPPPHTPRPTPRPPHRPAPHR